MQNQNGAAKTSASAKIFLLLSDGKWHTNDELYALNRRPSSIIFNLKARGVILEKKKDLEVRFLEHWRIVPGSAPAKLRLENGFIRSETGGISKEKAEGKPAEVKPVQSQVPPIPLQKLEEVSEPPRENELPQ